MDYDAMEVGLSPGHIVLDGDPALAHRKGHITPNFSPHVNCDQTAGWIKMPLGTEVGLGPGHIALDGDPALQGNGHSSPPLFGPRQLWPNGRPSLQLLNSCITWSCKSQSDSVISYSGNKMKRVQLCSVDTKFAAIRLSRT